MGTGRGRSVLHLTVPLLLGVLVAVGLIVVPTPRPARADPLPAYPIIYISPDCFTDQFAPFTFTLEGRNFEPNTTVIVTQFGSEGDPAKTVTPVTSEYGHFVTRMTLNLDPSFPNFRLDALYAYGTDPVAYAYGSGCGGDALVVATPNCGDPDNPAIHVTGARYGPRGVGSDITLQLRQGDVDIGSPRIVPASPSFDETWQPGVTLAAGEYTIVATQSATEGGYSWFGYDQFLVPCPQVTVTPTCVQQAGGPPDRMSILVSGIGWLQGTADGYDEIQVVFDPEGEAQEFSFSANPYEGEPGIGEDGSFGPLEINPYMRPASTYTIQIKQQEYRSDPLLDVLVTFTVPCLTPTLVVDPSCGPPELVGDEKRRYSLTVTGSDFFAGEDVTVVFDPDLIAGSNYPPETDTKLVERNGTFTLEVDAAYRPPGTYRIVAYQQLRSGLVQAEVPFPVPCFPPAPTLTIDPTCGPVATNLPLAYTINLVGAGFVPGLVDIVFDPTGLVPETATAIADDFGTFTRTIQVTGRPPGAYLIVASQTTIAGILDQVSVPFLVACEGVLLRITPTNGERGFVPLVEGFNFPASTTLTLRWDRGIGTSRPITVDTDENGTFRRQVLIFHGDFTGSRHMTVELTTDPLAYPDVGVDYLVTTTTVSPPFSLAGNPFSGPDATIVLRR